MIVPNSLHSVQYDSNPCYDLYGVLVHSGYDTRAGHYYCYIKNSNGIWHEMNDSTVPSLRLPLPFLRAWVLTPTLIILVRSAATSEPGASDEAAGLSSLLCENTRFFAGTAQWCPLSSRP